MRRKEYLSPEQIALGEKFEQIGRENSFYRLDSNPNSIISSNSDNLDNISFEESNKNIMNKMGKLTFSCDIFSIGVILFRCLIGITPPTSFYESLADFLKAEGANEKKPTDNIYIPPTFLQKYILSDGMCYILTRLLHPNPKMRYSSLYEVRKVLLELQHSIRTIPRLLRDVLGHPKIPDNDTIDSGMDELSPKKRRKSAEKDEKNVCDFRSSKLSEFSLKYLAKFIYESNIECTRINGGKLYLRKIKMNQIVDLDLSK